VKLAAFVLMVFGLSSVSMARPSSGPGIPNYDPSAIYGALKVKEKYLNPGIAGSSRTQKAVGGLVCIRSLLALPQAVPSFECQVDPAKQNFRSIYNALNAKEQFLNPGIAGSGRFLKLVGGLACMKSVLIVRRAKVEYDCVIAE
jgi:hypothetical protein